MVFSSLLFIYYFLPLFLIIYYTLPARARNSWTLVASLIFYAWGAPGFVIILALSTTLNFYLVKWLSKHTNEQTRRRILIVSISLNLLLLFYYKYTLFFIENINGLAGILNFNPLKLPDIVLPIGISFFTFQSITYTVDVYRRNSQAQKWLWDYMMYITLFPQMIAGPIVRYNEIAQAIKDRKEHETIANVSDGMIRFAIGLAKKVLLANPLGAFATTVFDGELGSMNASSMLLGAVAYSFQIYYDFAGYSDMAIGIGRMIGFRFPENFNAPYISRNISEFWRRWHITLGTFMRDYLYIPLGGNRVSNKIRLYFNLSIVFVLSGFWHGAAWTFIIWGVYHGTFLILDRLFYLRWVPKLGLLAMVINYMLVLISWIFFRANSLTDAIFIIQEISTPTHYGEIHPGPELITTLLLAACFAFLPANKQIHHWMEAIHTLRLKGLWKVVLIILAVLFILISSSALIKSDFNPFIYFRF
jgi:alginate O-acetyltransferase complex protein AlgI